MLTNEDKKQILESFLETVCGLSDKEYQERIWIRGEGPECDDFTETTCHFFEEVDGILENFRDFGINDKQCELLMNLMHQFDGFIKKSRPGYLPEQFIDSPEWGKIMHLAKEVLNSFSYKKN